MPEPVLHAEVWVEFEFDGTQQDRFLASAVRPQAERTVIRNRIFFIAVLIL